MKFLNWRNPCATAKGRMTLKMKAFSYSASIQSALVAAAMVSLYGQPPVPAPVITQPKLKYVQPFHVPSAVRPILDALGTRFQTSGSERLIATGQLRRSSGISTVQITTEISGQVRIEETGGRGRTLSFDTTTLNGKGPVDSDDEDLMESLGIDSPEQFIQNLGQGVSLRLLGHRFKVRGETGFGAEVDIFEVVMPVQSRSDKQNRVKHVMFDTQTQLLRRVAYTTTKGNQQVRTETIHSDYSLVNGHQIASRTQRLENGAEVFQFTRQSASIIPTVSDNLFRIP